MNGRHVRIDSPQLGRQVHMWTYGFFGPPLIAFPSAAGMAHEWQAQGMVEVLEPWLRAGRLKLYCPESNVAEAWTREGDPAWKIQRHLAYERFVLETLLPAIDNDCRTPDIPLMTAGCSLGATYAANFALKHPQRFRWALCMSGRYQVRSFVGPFDSTDVYYNNPLAYVPNLHGEALQHVREHANLTLVCGRGPFEGGCIEETLELGQWLDRKQIPNETDIWGRDSAHQWPWWRRQLRYHMARRLPLG